MRRAFKTLMRRRRFSLLRAALRSEQLRMLVKWAALDAALVRWLAGDGNGKHPHNR